MLVHTQHFIFSVIGATSPLNLHKFAYGVLLQTSVVMRPQDPSAWKDVSYIFRDVLEIVQDIWRLVDFVNFKM